MRVLVTGGTGYIGAHVVRLLQQRGDRVVVADDVVTGDASRIGDAPLVRLNLATDGAPTALEQTLREHEIDSVIHLAARKQVGESVERAAWYYQQNVGGLANLLLAMEASDVGRLVFSSSAAVYGPSDGPITEDGETRPVNPYGETKLVGEMLTRAATVALGLQSASLRYFNVAGAGWPELGDPAALNLVPMVFERLDAGEAPVIFGDDYNTPDGTCVRDYVHVMDVAEAHLAVLDWLATTEPGHHLFNIGTGRGVSVRQMVNAVITETGLSSTPVVESRRPGDPDSVVASVARIRETLGWSSTRDLDDMVRSAWEAHRFSALH